MKHLKLAIIGCGAQGERGHLRNTAGCNRIEVTALVDKDIARAQQLAQKYDVPMVTDDYRKIVGRADAAVVALPNYLHAPIAINLLQRGVHVLVEKPLALSVRECDAMLDAAGSSGATLAVGMILRFAKTAQFACQTLREGLLGNLLSFDLRMGNDLTKLTFNSDYLLRKQQVGGGVLIDVGVHALDLALWLFGDYVRVKYFDDALGGLEANSELHLGFRSGVAGFLEVSRVRNLRNTCIIQGRRGVLEFGILDQLGMLKLKINKQSIPLTPDGDTASESWREIFCRQLDDFAAASLERRQPFVPGHEGRRSIALVEECYASRRLLPQPWIFPKLDVVEERRASRVN